MAQFTTPPAIDGFETTLAQSWNGLVGTIFVDAIPDATLNGGDKTYVVVNPGKTTQQVGRISGWSAGQLTCDSVTVKKGAGTNYTPTTHSVKSKVIITDVYQTWEDIKTAVNSKSDIASPVFTGSVGLPTYVDATARNAAIPTPTQAMMVKTNNVVQHYNSATAQREDFDIGTPPPNASDTAKGVVEMSNPAQVTSGTSVGETGARLVVGPAELKTVTDGLSASIVGASAPEALFEKDQYIAGETILANDSLFVESLPTFAESTVLQNIGDVTANTRVAIVGFGSGVASNTLKLSLRKFVSPSVNLSVRIETVSGGNPTGTLVNANATATVTAASITTSLVDTTITLAGSINITKGQQVAIVLSQVGDVVNATNYYAVGYVARDTSTRKAKLWNGSVWSAGQNDRHYYISSTLFENRVLAETSASFNYKLPTDYVRIATQGYSIGQSVTSKYYGLHTYPGLVSNTAYYVANTPGAISAVAGSNVHFVGETVNDTLLFIGGGISNSYIIASGTIGASGSIDSLGIRASRDMVISVDCFRTSGASGSITVTLYEGLTSSPTTIVATAQSYDSAIGVVNIRYQTYTIKQGTFYRYVISGNANLVSGTYSITAKQI